MKTYLEYKNRIYGLEESAETIKAAEKISASYIHFLKSRALALGSYSSEIEKILGRLSLFYNNSKHPLLRERSSHLGKALLVVSGERGMAGGLWHNLGEVVAERAEEYKKIAVIGIKGQRYLQEKGVAFQKSFSFSYPLPLEEEISSVAGFVINEYLLAGVSAIDIAYPSFVSFTLSEPKFVSFLPFRFRQRGKRGADGGSLGFPVFEPSKKAVFDALLKRYIGVFFRKIIFEAKLSEFSSRAIAAEHSFEKAQEMIRKTQLRYYKERRISITKEQQEALLSRKVAAEKVD